MKMTCPHCKQAFELKLSSEDSLEFPKDLLEFVKASLAELVAYHNHVYWDHGEPEIPDTKFDCLERALAELDPKAEVLFKKHNPFEIYGTDPNDMSDVSEVNLSETLENVCVDYQLKAPPIPCCDFPSLNSLNHKCRYARTRICYTGFTEEDKCFLHEISERLGIEWKKCISRRLDFLVCGPNAGPSKIKKSQEYGIMIVPIDKFIEEVVKQ